MNNSIDQQKIIQWNHAIERLLHATDNAPNESIASMLRIEAANELVALAKNLANAHCTSCKGFGKRTYPNTSGWRGGIGGQAITTDICDQCWGTGERDRKGPNLRAMNSMIKELSK